MRNLICYGSDNNPIHELYQWDCNQTMTIVGADFEISAVHFCNRLSSKALVVKPTTTSTGTIVNIPNILLQQPEAIIAYLYQNGSEGNQRTLYSVSIPVIPRAKPEDYEFNENIEYISWVTVSAEIEQMMERLQTLIDGSENGLVGQRTTHCGEIFNDYENNKAFTPYSSASGTKSIAGWKGYPVKHEGDYNKVFTSEVHEITDAQGKVTNRTSRTAQVILLDASNADFPQKASDTLAIGDTIQIDGKMHYYDKVKICNFPNESVWFKKDDSGNTIVSVCCINAEEEISWNTFQTSEEAGDNWLWCIDKCVGTEITAHTAPVAFGNDDIAAGNGAFSAGKQNRSVGDYSATLGRSNRAGYASFAAGRDNNAMGMFAFAAGANNKALGTYSAAFGQNSEANGQYSFAFGEKAKANGARSVAFGSGTSTDEDASGAAVFGSKSQANGTCSFAAGNTAIANGMYSVAFGYSTNANADYSFAVGSTSTADGIFSVALNKGKTIEGANSALAINEATAKGICSLAQGNSTAKGGRSVALGSSVASGDYSMAQGQSTASGLASASFGLASAEADYALAQGTHSRAMAPNAVAFGQDTQAKGTNSLAGGNGSIAYGHRSIALGQNTITGDPDNASIGQNSFAFGTPATYTSNGETLTEYTTASGNCSVAFGYGNIASAQAAFIAGGLRNKAEGQYSFVAGNNCKATGKAAAAIGSGANALFDQSFAFGNFVSTRAKYQTVVGKFAKMTDQMLFGVGDGTGNPDDDYADEYRNAFSVFKDGHAEVREQGTTDNSVVIIAKLKAALSELKDEIVEEVLNSLPNGDEVEY